MKHTLTLIALLLIFGCKKSDDNNDGAAQQTTSSSFSAKVNGVLLTADSAKGSLHVDTSLGVPVRTLVIGGYCSGRNIVPGFADTLSSTTLTTLNYTNLSAGAELDYYPLSDTINSFYPIDASFKITSVDVVNKKVSGNFSGIVVGDVTGDTIIVTDGVFTNVDYTVW